MSSLTPARNRLEAFVQSRSEWCISRQRSWGVPIPALFDEAGKPLLNSESLSHIISVLESKGTDHWWTGPVSDFAPPNGVYTKGNDTLDVWFDSGSSWTLLNRVADVYLEGSDHTAAGFNRRCSRTSPPRRPPRTKTSSPTASSWTKTVKR
jgi:isoleucyl-tRNA synthetase